MRRAWAGAKPQRRPKNSENSGILTFKLLGKERERKAASADLYELIDSESNLREGPGTNYPIVRKSRKGEVGEALSNKNGWMKLQFSDGSVAWAHEQNIKAAK